MRDKRVKNGELLEITAKNEKLTVSGALKGMKPFTVKDELKVHD